MWLELGLETRILSVKVNTLWNLFGSILPLLVGIVALPYIFIQMGTERVGVFTLILALIGYFSIFDFGLGRALTQRVASCGATESNSGIENTIGAGIVLSLIIGLFVLIITIGPILIFGTEFIRPSPALQYEVQAAMILASLGLPATTMTAAYRGVLEGRARFKEANLLRLFLGLSNFLGPVATIHFIGPSLTYAVAIVVFSRYVVLVMHHYICKKAIVEKIVYHFSKGESRKFINFMGWMTISNSVSPLMVLADRFLISYVLGAAVVAFYTIPVDMMIRLLVLPAALTASLFPLFATLHTTGNVSESSRLYNKSLKLIFWIMTLIACAVIIGGKTALSFWLGQDFAYMAYPVASVVIIGILLNSLAQVPHSYIQATGDAKSTALIHLAETIVYIPLLILLLNSIGILGAAIAWTCRALLDFCLLHMRARFLQIGST